MSKFLSHQSVNLATFVATGMRAVQMGALSLSHPATLRRAKGQVVRLITVVAGH
jgi:hypothetical protein